MLVSKLRNKALLKRIILIAFCALTAFGAANATERTARLVLSELILADKETQPALIEELTGYGDPVIAEIYEAWRTGGVYTLDGEAGLRLLQFNALQQWTLVATGEVLNLSEAEVAATEKERASRAVRKLMKSIIDTLGLKAEDPAVRINSAIKMGRGQSPQFVTALEARLEIEPSDQVRDAIREALAISLLKNGDAIKGCQQSLI